MMILEAQVSDGVSRTCGVSGGIDRPKTVSMTAPIIVHEPRAGKIWSILWYIRFSELRAFFCEFSEKV